MTPKLNLLAAGMLLAAVTAGFGQPNITTQPQSCTNAVGATATFTVTATNGGPLAYQWQKLSGNWTDLADRTNTTLVLTNVQTSDDADYRVAITNLDGATNSAPAHLYVIVPPRITKVQNYNPSVSLGAPAKLQVWATGTWLNYQWWFDGQPLAGKTAALLNLTNVQTTDAGLYTVVVTNWAGSVSTNVSLDVDPTFTKITAGPPVTDVGSSVASAWGDYDGDGDPDLFVARDDAGGRSTLYHNNGDGSFTSVTNAPFPLPVQDWGSGAWADLDNDGRSDLVLIRWNGLPAIVYFNNGDSTFSPVQLAEASPCNIAVLDYNHDGLVDLVFGGNIHLIPGMPSWFYRNNGDRTFTRLSSADVGPIASFETDTAIFADYDDDGSEDVFCGNWAATSELFHNDGTGHFAPVSTVTFPSYVVVGAWGDYDNDGRLDLCVPYAGSSPGNPGTSVVYRNLGGGTFAPANIGQTIYGQYWSASWADYDNDGFLDLFVGAVNGYQNALYRNDGDGTFTRITTGSIVSDLPTSGAWGSYSGLWFDYDSDGFLDLYVINNNLSMSLSTVNCLYHNNGNSNAWLKVILIGTVSSRDAVGAKVRIQAAYAGQARWQRRDITGGDGWNGNQLYAHFGLGDAANVDVLRIEWPSGTVQELHNVPVRQCLTVTEPAQLRMAQPGQLQIQCWKGMSYAIECSSSLSGWIPMATVTNVNLTGGIQWTDPEAPGQSARFYRAVNQ